MYVLPMISAGQVLIAGIVSIVCFCMIIYRMFKARSNRAATYMYCPGVLWFRRGHYCVRRRLDRCEEVRRHESDGHVDHRTGDLRGTTAFCPTLAAAAGSELSIDHRPCSVF